MKTIANLTKAETDAMNERAAQIFNTDKAGWREAASLVDILGLGGLWQKRDAAIVIAYEFTHIHTDFKKDVIEGRIDLISCLIEAYGTPTQEEMVDKQEMARRIAVLREMKQDGRAYSAFLEFLDSPTSACCTSSKEWKAMNEEEQANLYDGITEEGRKAAYEAAHNL